MEVYFKNTSRAGGLYCWHDTKSQSSNVADVYREMIYRYKMSFKFLGDDAQYIPESHEHESRYYDHIKDDTPPCAIRLARQVFFEVRERLWSVVCGY